MLLISNIPFNDETELNILNKIPFSTLLASSFVTDIELFKHFAFQSNFHILLDRCILWSKWELV